MLPILSALQYQQNVATRNHDKLRNNEHKNFIQMNRKNVNCKTSRIKKSIDKSDLNTNYSKSLPPPPPLVKSRNDQKNINKTKVITKASQNNRDSLKSSLDRLVSIVSKGELERLIKLASDLKSNDEQLQPTHLCKHLDCFNMETQPTMAKVVHIEPTHVPGLGNEVLPSQLINNVPIAKQTNDSFETNNQNSSELITTQRNYGRGQGLRQLLELDASPTKQVTTDCSNYSGKSIHNNYINYSVYYPWGMPGCGAPLKSTQKSTTIKRLEEKSNSNQFVVNIKPGKDSSSSNLNESIHINMPAGDAPDKTGNLDNEEKRKRSNQYKIELQSQVEEKEKIRKEEREKIALAEQMEIVRLSRDQENLLQEAENENKRKRAKELAAKERYEFLQRRIEEEQQKSLKRKKEKAAARRSCAQDSNFPHNKPITIHNLTLLQDDSITDTTSENITSKDSKLKPQKISKASNQCVPQTINPPPTQLDVIQSPRTHNNSLTSDNHNSGSNEKSLKMPSVSLKISSLNELNSGGADTLQHKGVLSQLKQLKQNLHMKKQEADYEDSVQLELL